MVSALDGSWAEWSRTTNRPVNPPVGGHCQLCYSDKLPALSGALFIFHFAICSFQFQGSLGGTNKFANFFVVEIPVVFRRKFFLDKELYLHNHPPKPRKETKEERAARFQRLMDENGWTRAELALQLGVSRAWVTKVLRNLG